MKLLIFCAFLIACAPLSGAQAPHIQPAWNDTRTAPAKPKQDILPQTTLDFKPVGDGLPLSASAAFLGHFVCSSDGTFYLNAIMFPKGDRQIIAVSPMDKDKVSNYSMGSIMGLVNVSPSAIDAEGSDLYVLAEAAKSDDLLNNDVKSDSKDFWRHTQLFILHFHGDPSAPDVIPLDLPFQPKQFAATSEGKFVFLGLERTNQTPVLALVDSSGELERYIDVYRDFGTNESIISNEPQRLKDQFKTMPEGTGLDSVLTVAQFVHYRDSLLLLMPGTNAKVFTIRGGGIESTALHLPAGFEAESLIPSNTSWLVHARDGNDRELIVMINPSNGKAIRIIHSPQFRVNDITCVHDGDYYGIHWPRGKEKNQKAYLMEAGQ